MIIITPATLELDRAGFPYAPEYGDIYHSRAGGYAQGREVFLAGNGLPERWGDRLVFTILETGFGLGTNFLATWAAWRADPRRPARLHYLSVELHPFHADDLRAWHGRDAEMAGLGEQLAAAWPALTPGMHRIELEQGRVVLTLVFGDASTVLANLHLRADALYPDGFTPRRNPVLWSPSVFEGLARLAAPGATLATYTIARPVMDGLTAAGFAVRKAPGFGGKRDMLVGKIAVPRGESEAAYLCPRWPERHAMVIGAGIAGVAAADSLAARGWRVSLIDVATGVARGASSAPAGAVHALLARDDSRLARFTRAGYLHMDRRLAGLPGDWHAACGRFDMLEAGAAQEKAVETMAHLGLPAGFVSAIDAGGASELAGTRVARGGYWFPRGTWLHAGSYCSAVLARHGERVRLLGGCAVASLRRVGNKWVALDASGGEIAGAPVAILAAGADLVRLAGLDAQVMPLQRVRGQLTGVLADACRAPRVIVSGAGYCLPPVRGMIWTGATYGPGDAGAAIRPAEHLSNLERLAHLLPENSFAGVPAGSMGHVGFRAVAPDRLPLVGGLPDVQVTVANGRGKRSPALQELPRQAGLYVSGGMASRGLTWAALSGEVLASMIEGEPLPIEADLLEAIDPARFLERGLRRGQIS